ncbi:MAG: SpoIVB peptidase S55 domain-containing protein [Candidatus Sumerlaeia bacterium]
MPQSAIRRSRLRIRTPQTAIHSLILAFAAAALLATSAWAAAGEPLPPQFMPSSELKPGMVGEGRTVFHGFKVEPFKATILGVRHNALPGSNMIIAKLEGPMLAGHGVVAGMSGSPVFVDGRLIGAVAYGWTFAYEPVCGITPIESMWQVWRNIGQPALAKPQPRSAGPELEAGAWDWEADWAKFQRIMNGSAPEQVSNSAIGAPQSAIDYQDSEYGRLRPLLTPFLISGASPAAVRRLAPFFASRGLELIDAGPLAAGAGADSAEPAPPLEPGSALSVPMLIGDMNVGGIGTVTWRDGDKLIAFGHPMRLGGGSATPMAAAWVISFMESYERSFKLGEVRDLVGTVDQDRIYAIGGKLGPVPPFIPINVVVGGPAAANPRAFRFKAWKDADYLPLLSMAAVDAAWTSGIGGGEMTIDTQYTIRLADGRAIAKKTVSSSEGGAIAIPLNLLLFDMFALLQNPFHEADVAGLDVSINARVGRRDGLELLSLTADHGQYRAGDTVRMSARVRPWRGAEQTRSIDLALPRPLKPGTYIIQLADSAAAQIVERMSRPGVFAPRRFEDVVGLVAASDFSPEQMRLYLFAPSATVVLKGKPLGEIPSSMETLVRESAPAQLQQQAVGNRLDMRVLSMEAPIQGSASLAIQVVDHFDE